MSAAEKLIQEKPRARKRRPTPRVKRSKFNLEDLKEPFEPHEIEWKPIAQGIKNDKPWAVVVPFVTARAVMNRLDQVVGPANWKDDFQPIGSGFFCAISIRIDGEWISKMDGADETDIAAFKGGMSDARKRAAVVWGIGRYLYDVPQMFADFDQVYKNTQGALPIDIEIKDDGGKVLRIERYYWLPPELPKWALPMKAVEIQKARKEKEAVERRQKLAAQPKNRAVIQDEITRACISRGITPKELGTIVADKFQVNHQDDLSIDQLEELQHYLEGKV